MLHEFFAGFRNLPSLPQNAHEHFDFAFRLDLLDRILDVARGQNVIAEYVKAFDYSNFSRDKLPDAQVREFFADTNWNLALSACNQ